MVVTIGTKLFLWLTGPMILLMALLGYLDVRAGRQNLREELKREGRAVSRTMQLAIEDALRDRQLEDVREFADQIAGYERIYGARIFDADGNLFHQSSSLDAYPFIHPETLKAVLRDGVPRETYRQLGDQPVVTFIVPLNGPDAGRGALQVLQLESYIEEDARSARNFIILLTTTMILAAGGVVLLVTRVHVGAPVADLVARFREVGSVEAPRPVPVRRSDEFGLLAEEFNGMCRRLQASQESLTEEQAERRSVEGKLREAERLASVGRLAAGLAHEIGTPLNVIRGRAESLQIRLAGVPHADKGLPIIVSQIDRIARIVAGMLDFARVREPNLTPLDLASLIRKVIEFMAHRFEEARIRVEANLPDHATATLDGDRMYQVFLNLASNALDAMPRGGVLKVSLERVEAKPPEGATPLACLAVAFEDSGVGILPEDVSRVFDPFFTTKDVGRGTGLGLSVSYGIVQEHGGWIDLDSRVGAGTRMTVFLPVDPGAAKGGATA